MLRCIRDGEIDVAIISNEIFAEDAYLPSGTERAGFIENPNLLRDDLYFTVGMVALMCPECAAPRAFNGTTYSERSCSALS